MQITFRRQILSSLTLLREIIGGFLSADQQKNAKTEFSLLISTRRTLLLQFPTPIAYTVLIRTIGV